MLQCGGELGKTQARGQKSECRGNMLISLHHQSIDFPNLSKSDRTTPSTLQRVSACFSPVATRPNSLVGDRALTSSKFSVSRLPRILSRAALLLRKSSRTLSGSLVGYSDDRRARGGLRSLSEPDCRARCRLRFSAFAQRKNEGLVSLFASLCHASAGADFRSVAPLQIPPYSCPPPAPSP